MAESEAIQAEVTQVAIWAAAAAVKVVREADTRLTSGTTIASTGETFRHRHGRPVLRQPSFD